MLSSVVSNSNSTSIRGTSKELKSDDSPMVADEKAIQDAYQEALVDEGVSDIIDRMKKEQADYIKWFDNYFSAAESYTDDYAELDYDKYHKRLADYECIKSKSENAHFENDKQLQVYNECNEELLRKICEVRQEGVSDEILNEAVVLANDTLNLAETNKLLASELVAVDKERKTKIEDIQDMLDIIRIAATEDIEYWLNDLPYEFANDAATISNSVNQLKVIETEIKLEEKAQYWSKDLVESYIPGASYWEKFDYNDASEIEGIYHIMQYYNDLVLGENVYSNIIKTLEYPSGISGYESIGAIIEKYYPEAKTARLEYESSATCQAYKMLLKDYREEVDKIATVYNEQRIENDKRYKVLENRKYTLSRLYSYEIENYINQEVVEAGMRLEGSQDAYNTAVSNTVSAATAKEEVDTILELRNINPSQPDNPGEPTTPAQPDNPSEPTKPEQPDRPGEPTPPEQSDKPDEPTNPDQPDNPGEPTNPNQPDNPGEPTNPDQPDNPGEPTNPDQPDNPGEPTNPNQPKPCYPTKIVIDIDGTITVNIVSEIEASIDFDGHFGIKFQP